MNITEKKRHGSQLKLQCQDLEISPIKGSTGTRYWRGRWRPDFENSLNAVWKVDWRGQVLEIRTTCKKEKVFASRSRSEEGRAGEAMSGTWPQKIAPKWKFHMADQHVLGDIRKCLSLVTNYRAVLDSHLYPLSFPLTDSQSYKEKESRHCSQVFSGPRGCIAFCRERGVSRNQPRLSLTARQVPRWDLIATKDSKLAAVN